MRIFVPKKKVCIGLIILILATALCACATRERDLKDYLTGHGLFDEEATAVLPLKESLPQDQTIKYQYDYGYRCSNFQGAFLRIQYDSDSYETAKNALQEQYTFWEKDIRNSYYACKYSFSIGSYCFQAVDMREHPLYDEKYVGLIAYNDSEASITYLFYFSEFETVMSVEMSLKNVFLPYSQMWE